jgi:hypothetical protein
MATETQPVPEAYVEVPGKDDLSSKLDELLEHYLHTLDAYQKTQKQLTERLSSVSGPTREHGVASIMSFRSLIIVLCRVTFL